MPLDDCPSIVTTRAGTLGDWAAAAFAIAAVSGVAVAVPYDPAAGYSSLATLLLTNPAGVLLRNIHYWSGQLCLPLTAAHIFDHLRTRTEGRVRTGVWLRLGLAVPLTAFIMLSGFLLRDDADAQQALRILAEATGRIPWAGTALATLFFGTAVQLSPVYVHHVATATIVVWLIVIEHARRVWPRTTAFFGVLTITTALSLVFSPGLHDGLAPVIKGPWYFLGFQELLHWSTRPLVVVGGGAGVVGLIAAIRFLPARAGDLVRVSLLVVVFVYAALCGVGAFLRGEHWSWGVTTLTGPSDLRVGWVFAATPDAPARLPVPLPQALGRPEGCLVCHAGVTGLGNAHRPDALGCASCHGGDVFTLDKARAHRGMDAVAGNLANARLRCGQAACHPTVVPRVERSLMATMGGVIAVNRSVFGETTNGEASRPAHVAALGQSPADTHLRQLCASCHLGEQKTDLGPNGEDARGGGCAACHLSYSDETLAALRRYEAAKALGVADAPRHHPAVSLDIGNGQCFGCHSRSGRIATNYEGWHEMHDPPASASDPWRPSPSTTRVLADTRVFERVLPDVHQQRGLDCIDCHTAREVMGDGTVLDRKGHARRVTCVDCHVTPGSRTATVTRDQLDPESRRILAARKWPGPPAFTFGVARSGEALINLIVDGSGTATLVRKRTGERRPVRPALGVCTAGKGHARLSCGACHTAWAPRCPTCHTSYDATADAYDWVAGADVRGAWKEEAGPFVANAPTLGVRRVARSADARAALETIETFVPGMVMTLDRNRRAGGQPDAVFRRIYARVEPHTTRREARSCVSCHANPEALGYGRGSLLFERRDRTGRWRFTPAAALSADGLPADAWIPFLGEGRGMLSTRDDVRPFSVAEQRRLLAAGACLTCHAGESRVMQDAIRDFEAAVEARGRACAIAAWEP